MMSKTARYIFTAIGLVLLGYLLWYFKNIVIYILVSLVLSLLGRPIFDLLGKIRIRKRCLPAAIRSLITLVVIIGAFLTFFGIFIPLIVNKAYELSNLDIQRLVASLQVPLGNLEKLLDRFRVLPEGGFSIQELALTIASKINISSVADFFSTVAGAIGNVAVAVFSIVFITFFFLKDESLFANALLSVIPDHMADEVTSIMSSTKRLLVRYFGGLTLEVTGVILLSFIGFLIVGISFSDSLLMGFLAGIFNIIPYIGPMMGGSFALLIGFVTHMQLPFRTELLPLLIWVLVVCVVVQVIDNWIFQPFIYSSSINAHPLEIFIVFLMAGSLGGMVGMIVAVPAYIVIRVFAKEFFNNFKFVRSLTKNI
ncbi:MAG: AI-2E family transporter [Bacteroidales bacterium]|nr:AI-2E family transporter [Bacteroidales bacterium]